MSARQTPGRRLKRLIDAALAPGCSWTEQEQVAIDKAVKPDLGHDPALISAAWL